MTTNWSVLHDTMNIIDLFAFSNIYLFFWGFLKINCAKNTLILELWTIQWTKKIEIIFIKYLFIFWNFSGFFQPEKEFFKYFWN